MGLCLTLLLSLLAFAHCGLLALGSQIHDLRSFTIALSSCFRFIFTGMRYEEFRVAGAFLGPIYYIAFKVRQFQPLLACRPTSVLVPGRVLCVDTLRTANEVERFEG